MLVCVCVSEKLHVQENIYLMFKILGMHMYLSTSTNVLCIY